MGHNRPNAGQDVAAAVSENVCTHFQESAMGSVYGER